MIWLNVHREKKGNLVSWLIGFLFSFWPSFLILWGHLRTSWTSILLFRNSCGLTGQYNTNRWPGKVGLWRILAATWLSLNFKENWHYFFIDWILNFKLFYQVICHSLWRSIPFWSWGDWLFPGQLHPFYWNLHHHFRIWSRFHQSKFVLCS